jgi:hypothetical protein
MLTAEHISILDKRVAEFRSADLAARKDIIEEVADRIKRGWNEKVEFDRETIEAVSALSATWAILKRYLLSLFADTCLTALNGGIQSPYSPYGRSGRILMLCRKTTA